MRTSNRDFIKSASFALIAALLAQDLAYAAGGTAPEIKLPASMAYVRPVTGDGGLNQSVTVSYAGRNGTVYEPALKRLRDAALKSGARGLEPDAVAKAVLRAITARKPPTRILVVGKGRFFQRIVRLLPDRLIDRLVGKQIWMR